MSIVDQGKSVTHNHNHLLQQFTSSRQILGKDIKQSVSATFARNLKGFNNVHTGKHIYVFKTRWLDPLKNITPCMVTPCMVTPCMVTPCMVTPCMVSGKVWSRTQAVTRSWNEAGEGGEKKLLY